MVAIKTFPRLAVALIATVAALLITSCGGSATQPLSPEAATPVAVGNTPTIQNQATFLKEATLPPPTSVSTTLLRTPSESQTAVPIPRSIATLVPTPVSAPVAEPTVTDTTAPTQRPQETQQSSSGDDRSSTDGPTSVPHAATVREPTTVAPTDSQSSSHSNGRWSFNGTVWAPNGTPPDCSVPMDLQTPVDISLVTNALWPAPIDASLVVIHSLPWQ